MALVFNEILGTEVRIPEVHTRIVSFSPAATETLFGIGAGENVVGVSALCARPPEVKEKRKVGSYNTIATKSSTSCGPTGRESWPPHFFAG